MKYFNSTFNLNSIPRIRILGLFSLFFLSGEIYSQNLNESKLITVKAYILGKGDPLFDKYWVPSYFTVGIVQNNQDTAISFWIMEQSWPIDNWCTDNDSISLSFFGADMNGPTRITLLPHCSINFYFLLNPRTLAMDSVNFRLGFNYNASDMIITKNSIIHKYWSKSMTFPKKLYRYEVD